MTEVARRHGFVGEITGDTFASADDFETLLNNTDSEDSGGEKVGILRNARKRGKQN